MPKKPDAYYRPENLNRGATIFITAGHGSPWWRNKIVGHRRRCGPVRGGRSTGVGFEPG